MQRSENINELAAALSKAQGVMEKAAKDKNNPAFGKNSKYADLASIWDAIREPLAKNDLAVLQLPDEADGKVRITTILMHKSGQWIEASYGLSPTKSDPQGFGSAITYMKRYALTGVGVAPEDDDGNAASTRGTPDPVTPYSAVPTRQNGNGGNSVDPRAAAKKWQEEAMAAIKAMPDAKSLSAWEEKNTSAAVKLRGIDEGLHRTLTDALADAYERLNPVAAQ